MQRAVMAMPPGASCLLANIFLLMIGLADASRPNARTGPPSGGFRGFHRTMGTWEELHLWPARVGLLLPGGEEGERLFARVLALAGIWRRRWTPIWLKPTR